MLIIEQRKRILNWSSLTFFLIFLICQAHSEIGGLMPDTNDINSVIKFASSVQYHLDNNYKLNDLSQSYLNKMNDLRKIFKDMTILLSRSESLAEKSFEEHLNIFHTIIYQLDNSATTEIDLNLLKKIKYRFRAIENFVNSTKSFYTRSNNVTYMCNLANSGWAYLSQPFKHNLNELFFDVNNAIIDKLQKHTNTNECRLKISIQRELHSFLEILMKKNIQEYIFTTYTWALKYKCQESSIKQKEWRDTNTKIKNKFLLDFNQCIKYIHETLTSLPRSIYQCDVKEHVKDFTYFELERMWQMFIANEYDLNIDDSCRYDCNFPKTSLVKNYQDDGTQCQEIVDCKYLPSPLTVCALNHKPRRLEWFQDGDGFIYGSNYTSCSGEIKDLFSTLWWLRVCDYCICTCKGQKSDETSNILTSTISFRSEITDIHKNMVVAGIRFRKINNMIYVQIKQGKILPRGKIDKSTLAWKPLENTIYDDQGVEATMYFNTESNNPLIDGIDYGDISNLDLDDLIAPKNYLVTGVRFNYAHNIYATSENENNKHVEFQIQVTPFDYLHGVLTRLKETHWISPSENVENNYDEQLNSFSEKFVDRKELLLKAADSPIKSSNNVPDSEANQYVKFQASDMKKDAGQSTVPFFDGQPIEGNPAFPLSGIGIFHKGSKGFGGFLSFRIYDLNFADYMIWMDYMDGYMDILESEKPK